MKGEVRPLGSRVGVFLFFVTCVSRYRALQSVATSTQSFVNQNGHVLQKSSASFHGGVHDQCSD